MTVLELIEKLKELPQDMKVVKGNNHPIIIEQVWDDEEFKYVVIL